MLELEDFITTDNNIFNLYNDIKNKNLTFSSLKKKFDISNINDGIDNNNYSDFYDKKIPLPSIEYLQKQRDGFLQK